VGFEIPSFGGDRVFVPFPPFASRFYPFIPHSLLGGLMGSFSFGVLEGVGVIAVLGGFSGDGIELVRVRTPSQRLGLGA